MQTDFTSTERPRAAPDRSPSDAPAHHNPRIAVTLLAIVAAFVVSGGILYTAGDRESFATCVNLPSILWVLLVPPAILSGIYGLSGIVDAFSYLFRQPTPGKTADDAMTLFRLWAAFALASGLMATLVALVAMLTALEDPAQLGPGMAVALLSQLYGVVVAVICVAIAAAIGRRHNGPSAALRLARQSAGVAGLTVVAGCMTVLVAFGIFMLAIPMGR